MLRKSGFSSGVDERHNQISKVSFSLGKSIVIPVDKPCGKTLYVLRRGNMGNRMERGMEMAKNPGRFGLINTGN